MDINNLGTLITAGGLLFSLGMMCLFVVVFGAVGFFIYRMIMRSKALGDAVKTWPSTTGTVERGFVEVSNHTSGTGRSTSYEPKVIYAFQVNGQQYRGDKVKLGLVVRSGGYMGAQQIVDRYPAGSTVTVYYNPANPAQCAIEQ